MANEDMKELARQADVILNTPLFQQVMAHLTDDVARRWASAEFPSPEAREAAYWAVQGAVKFRQDLQSYLDTIKLRAKQ